jgi:hypothetical protein
VAHYMIEKGFKNVKVVRGGPSEGGGAEMEKFFEYYRGGKIINPLTGKITVLRK